MSADLSPEAYDVARVSLLDQLEVAQERLGQASLNAALSGDDTAMIAAEDEVRRIRQKLEGLTYGRKQAEAKQKERDDAAKLERRRQSAVGILSLVNRRFWATQALDEALDAVNRAVGDIESLGNELTLDASQWFDRDLRSQEKFQRFLMLVEAYDMTDTAWRVNRDIGKTERYARSLPSTRSMAIQTLSIVMPEAADEAVQREAYDKARVDGGHDG